MSPASYRTAPPRVGEHHFTRPCPPEAIRRGCETTHRLAGPLSDLRSAALGWRIAAFGCRGLAVGRRCGAVLGRRRVAGGGVELGLSLGRLLQGRLLAGLVLAVGGPGHPTQGSPAGPR